MNIENPKAICFSFGCAHARHLRLIVACLLGALAPAPAQSSPVALQLKDGDRVVLLGDGLIEQEQYFGWFEVMLTAAFPEAQVTYRNLGWSADTPAGVSRLGLSLLQAGREQPGEGWTQLRNQLELVEPTVAVLGYGMASSLESGASGLAGGNWPTGQADAVVGRVARLRAGRGGQ